MTIDSIFAFAERIMAMDDVAWSKHANPKSAYTRLLSGPAVFFALWSPFWIGWWGIIVIAIAAVWIWLNPRLFSAPTRTDSWATQVVLGERVFLRRAETPVPESHVKVAKIATALSAGFLVLTVLGFARADFWLAFTAWHASIVSKVWFCDRMVWLWHDMKGQTKAYRAWHNAEWNNAE